MKLKLRIASDLHTEMLTRETLESVVTTKILPFMEDDCEQILMLAGDIGSCRAKDNFNRFFDLVAPRFKEVYGIAGNHESYSGKIGDMDFTKDNINFNNNTVTHINKLKIIKATLWTDFNNGDIEVMQTIKRSLNDYRAIRMLSGEHISPEYIYLEHRFSKKMLEKNMNENSIVMTHHAPSLKSIHKHYIGSKINFGFYSDLEDLIIDKKPKLWIAGHCHNSYDYNIGDTRLVCNPFGYPNEYRVGEEYNPKLVIEI